MTSTKASDLSCHVCGQRFDEHVVYLDVVPPDATEGAFDVPTTGLYCPGPA